ncbi:MAG: hypothetical protein QOE75_2123 [Solirubrobacterales bacterium]|jgi:hypothetical protein|nr:hypothetical protein [Solirubrobacterales bacterium]
MTSKTRSFRISPAMILSIVALFVALGGSAYAVGIGKNTVRSPQIVDGSVRTVDVRDNAVNAAKVAPDAIGNEELAENSVTSQQVVDETLTNQDLGAASVTSSEITDGSVGSADVSDNSLTAADLGANSVGSSELQTGSVRAAELGTIIQVSQTEAIKGNTNKTATILCPEGTTAISGGGFGTLYSIQMSGSFRNGNGWRVDAKNTSATDGAITAYAYCLSGGSSN